ncbi:indolepyruvate ferredoxin oxidoreductase subunit alpha [Acetatifactor muris]|uniref:indolepyruvate ferredoxin oxidoreductase subunit alpha n=1 Tax=Acetatifactor muris TaxID=879566 RepID=UPI000CD1502B|nr:indolepyruvate ferredoxin oxidoreductase subunit alpha [Acetatifactor muris]MCR2048953.1 indolepyruvate ferredoxin oxidoreductase subunit alpha [Acetatifactor muris]
MSEKKILLGNEAIARGAYEAGVKVSAAYPGTPSTEISESIAKYEEVYAEWSPNEKVAAEVAIGASIAGARAMCSMKHVGVNVASDPLFTAAYTGVGGGLVVVAADDPGMYSSQNEQDSRMVARAAMIPVLEPSDSAEAKEFTKLAFELSEEYDTPVMVRSTTRLSHSQGVVELEARNERENVPYERNTGKYVMMPANAIKRHVTVEERLKRMAEDACGMSLNRAEYRDLSTGFITSGIPYQYVREAMPEASVLKLGLVHPLPRKLIEEFASRVDRLYIFEELEPVIEEQVKSWGILKAVGKDIFTVQGEYSANMLREQVLGEKCRVRTPESVPARPPILCPGCPHRSVYSVLSRLKMHAAGDIGCYTLGALAPLSVIDSTICMGSSISTLHGMEKARGKEYIRDWVAVIGDSTFMHTGINSLMNMVYNQSSGTVVILDNSTTGMTGHQDHAATGKTLKGEVVPAINIADLCRSLGIRHVYEISAFDLEGLEEAFRRETKRNEVSVIITKAPCVLLKGVTFPDKCVPVPEKCKKCGACLRPGCPALTKNTDGTVSIDETMCNGCGLCAKLCKFDAIEIRNKN